MDNSIPPTIEQKPTREPKKQSFRVILAIVVFVAFGIGYYLYTTQENISLQTNPVPTESTISPAAENPTSTNKSTTISFDPPSNPQEPITIKSGEKIDFDVIVNPGSNVITFMRLIVEYDKDKLKPVGTNAFKADASFPNIIEGPVYAEGKISVVLTVGTDPTKALSKKTKAATVTFEALSKTETGNPTIVSYSSETSALSIASQDNASDNVIAATVPAAIAIVE